MKEVDTTALFILAELTETGPARRCDLRHAARVTRAQDRRRIRTSPTLRRLQHSGLIEATRVRRGRWLATRTAYVITGGGRRELGALRDILLARELAAAHPSPDSARERVRWWDTARIAFSVWFEMPLARRSGELRWTSSGSQRTSR
jgi:hypothetical protein